VLPEESILLESIQNPDESTEAFRSKDVISFADRTVISNERACRFEEFAYCCRKGLKEKFMNVNQDFMVIQNGLKGIKLYVVFEGLGMNTGNFLDFVKIHLSIAVMGNSMVIKETEKVLKGACEYVRDMITESEKDQNF